MRQQDITDKSVGACERIRLASRDAHGLQRPDSPGRIRCAVFLIVDEEFKSPHEGRGLSGESSRVWRQNEELFEEFSRVLFAGGPVGLAVGMPAVPVVEA